MEKDLDEISEAVIDSLINTDLGKVRIERAEQRGIRIGEQNATKRIFHQLCKQMSEEEARRITGYTGD